MNVFSQDLENPRIIAVDDNGVVFVTQPTAGEVTALRDTTGDGRADDVHTVIADLDDGVVCVGPKQVVLDRDVNLLPTAGKNDQDQLP